MSIYIDVDQIIDQISDEELLEEVRDRKLHVNQLGQIEHFDRGYAERAYEELAGGRTSSALAMLERALFPTIVTPKDYQKALAA